MHAHGQARADGRARADGHAHDVGDHSAYLTGGERVEVLERIFDENDKTAAANRADFAAEGEEKPLKYPLMFRSCGLVVVNKVDLLPSLGFDLDGVSAASASATRRAPR